MFGNDKELLRSFIGKYWKITTECKKARKYWKPSMD
jgi:hypothetical protein